MFAKVVAWTLGSLVFAGAAAFSEGAVNVRVLEKKPDGTHVRLIVPAALVPLGLEFVPAGNLREASAELKPWRPKIQAAVDGLEKCPDGLLVEVIDPDEHVRVAKEGSSLVVDVDDRENVVHLSVPLGTVRRVLRRLAESGSEI